MQVCSEEFCDEVASGEGQRIAIEPIYCQSCAYMSSRGEMKMSLREMTWESA